MHAILVIRDVISARLSEFCYFFARCLSALRVVRFSMSVFMLHFGLLTSNLIFGNIIPDVDVPLFAVSGRIALNQPERRQTLEERSHCTRSALEQFFTLLAG